VGDTLPEVAVKHATSKDAGQCVPVLTKEELAVALGQKKKKVSMQVPERNPIR
jgi:hypothetical protein